jgi:hypothetical protein
METTNMNKRLIVALLFFLSIVPALVDAGEKEFRNELDAKVTQLTELLKDSYAEEHLPARGIRLLKKTVGDTTVAVVVFTLEGFGRGNNYFQYLAVFNGSVEESEDGPLGISLLDYTMVGGKGIRGIEFDQIKVEKMKNEILITIPAMEYSPNDPMCCPNIKSVARFKLKVIPLLGSRIEEIGNRKETTKKVRHNK